MVILIVMLTMAVFVSVDVILRITMRIVQASRKKRERMDLIDRASIRRQDSDQGLALPAGLFVHRGHTWAEIGRSGSVRVGLDDFVRRILGRLDRVVIRRPGERVAQGEAMLALEKDGRRVLLPAPVSGVIETVNGPLIAHPEGLEDAYRDGWAYTLRPSRLGEEVRILRVAEAGMTWLREEMGRFVDWMAGMRPAAALQDGGMPATGALAHLDDVAWESFQKEFLGDPGSRTEWISDEA